MDKIEVDWELIFEFHLTKPGRWEDEETGLRLEEETRLDDDDWYSHWRMVVSREDEFLIRHYYRGEFKRSLTSWTHAGMNRPSTYAFVEVFAFPLLVPATTITEYMTNDEFSEAYLWTE